MSGGGFRGRGFGPRGIRPGGPSGGRGGPRFPRPPFNRLPYPRHGSENWHEPPVQPFFPPWQYNGRGQYPKFPVRPPFRHDASFLQGRGRGQNVRGMPPRMRMPGVPGPYRPELQNENEVHRLPTQNEQQESSASLPQTSPAPPLGSEEERQQKITEAADKLKQKLSSIKNQEIGNFWEDDLDLVPSTSSKESSNKEEVAELHPQDFSLTFHDLKDIGRVDLHRPPVQDDSVVVLDEVCKRNFVEISLLDEDARNPECESECNVPNNEVQEEAAIAKEDAIDQDIQKKIPTIDSSVTQSQENTTLQTHQDNTPNFPEEIPHHNPPVRFNCRPEFHRGNVNMPPRFIPRQMGPRFRMPYPQEMSPMGPRRAIPLRPMHPNCRPPPNQLDVPRLMFDPRTPPPAVFNRLPPPSNFHPMDQNLSIDVPPQMQADPMHPGLRFGPRGPPPPHLRPPPNIQCNASPQKQMNFPNFDPRKPPPSVLIAQEELLQPPPAFDPRLSYQERQRLFPTATPAQLHPPLSMQVPRPTIQPAQPLSGPLPLATGPPPPPPAPPGPLLEMVPMTDYDMIPNYPMANNLDMRQSHFPQMDDVQPLSQQQASELEKNYMDLGGELFMEPPPEPPILSDYCSPPLPETLPPVDAPLPPVDAPLPPADAPLPPADAPLPPADAPLPPSHAPLPPADVLLPSTEVPLPSTKVPLPISEPSSVPSLNKQVLKTACTMETSRQRKLPTVSKEAIPTVASQPKTDMDILKPKRLRTRRSKRDTAATCLVPTVSMLPNDKVHTVQNQDTSKQYQNIQEEMPLSEEQSRPKVIFNLNAKIKKISKQEEWQQQADTSTARHRKLKAQMAAVDGPDNVSRIKSRSQLCKSPSPKSSKSLSSSRKGSEVRVRVAESSWKSTVIERFLKMSKNDIRNILNNSGLRKFDIAMKHLVKERRSSLSWEMRNNEDEKIKSYDREQFICQLNEMLDPSATIDITNLPTEFIRHLGEVLQLNSLPQDQTDSAQHPEVEITPVNTTTKSESVEPTYKLYAKATPRTLIKQEINIGMDVDEVQADTTMDDVQMNVEKTQEPQDTLLNMDLDDIFLAGIAKAKHGSKSATPEKAVSDFDVFFGPSGGETSQSPMITESVPETEKLQEETNFAESRIDKCERWHRKARDDPDMFRNLTKEEWEAKYGKSINGIEVSKPTSSLDDNESSSNKEDISIDSVKSLSNKNFIDRNPRVHHIRVLPANKHSSNIAKSTSFHQEYQSIKGRSSSDSNSMVVAEVIESINPIEISESAWRERSSETCPTITRSSRETKSGEDSNERRSTSETRREKLFGETEIDRKYREDMSSLRRSRRRDRKRKTNKKEKERRRRKRRPASRDSNSSYSGSESDSITLFTELQIKKEIIVKDEPGVGEQVESSVEKTTGRPELNEYNNQSALNELTTDKVLVTNETVVTNQASVTDKELITSQELGTGQGSITRQECTSNKETSLQVRKQSKPTILEMSKVPNKVLMECFEKQSSDLMKTGVTAGNTINSQTVDAVALIKALESTSKKTHSTKPELLKEKHVVSTSRSLKNKVLDKSKEEKDEATSVTLLNKDTINVPQKSDKRPKDTVPKDAASVRSSSIEESSERKSGRDAVDKVDTGSGTVRSKSSEERPSMKFQNIKSEGRKEMKLIEEKAKKRSSSLLRDKKSGTTKHSKMLTTHLKSSKVKTSKEKVSTGTAESSEHRKQVVEIKIPTEDNPDIKDPRLSKLKERSQESPNKLPKDSHCKILYEKSIVDAITEEQSKQQTQNSPSTLTSQENVNKVSRDFEESVQTPLTVETCTVDSNSKALENTIPEVTSPCSIDSPFKGFSEESQLPSVQLARSTLLRSQAELLNGVVASEELIAEEIDRNIIFCTRTTFPNEDSNLQNQETTSVEVLPEKSEEPEAKDVTYVLVNSATGDSKDIQRDQRIEVVQVSSDLLNEKEDSGQLIVDKETHVEGMCIDVGTRVDENKQQDKVNENIVDTGKSAVEKLQDFDNLKETNVEETSVIEKFQSIETFDSPKVEAEVAKCLEVAETDGRERSSATVKIAESAKISEVEKVAVVEKKYELVKIDTTVKSMVVKKEQEAEKSVVAEKVQEASQMHGLAKTIEPLKVVDLVKSCAMVKSHEKIKSHDIMKIHEGSKSSLAKKTQERSKSHDVTQEITKTHGTKRLETVKTLDGVKSSVAKRNRGRNKVDDVAKVDEAKKSTVVEKTHDFAKIHNLKKEHTQIPEVLRSSVALKKHELVKLSEMEKLPDVTKSPVILKRHEVVKSPEVQKTLEGVKSSSVSKKHEILKASEAEKATEGLKPPVALKRHDCLKSCEIVNPLEVETTEEVVKTSVTHKRHDAEKIQEVVKPSALLGGMDVKSPVIEKMEHVGKSAAVSKRQDVTKSPVMENMQEVDKTSVSMKKHEAVKSTISEKAQDVVKSSATSKRHEVVKSPVVEKKQEAVKPPKTSKRHEVVKSPFVEKTQEAVKSSTTSKRHETVKSPVVEKTQEIVKQSATLKRHEVVKSPVVEKTQLVKSSTTSKRHETVKLPAVEKVQEVVKPSTTLKRYEVVKSPVAEKRDEVFKQCATLKRNEEVKSPVVEKTQEVAKPSTTSKRHEKVKSPAIEKIQEAFKSSATLKRNEEVKSPVVEKIHEVVKPSAISKRHEVVKPAVVEKREEAIKPSTTLRRHEDVKSPAVEKTEEAIKSSTTLERHEAVQSPVAEKTQEAIKPSEAIKTREEVKSPEIEKSQKVVETQDKVKICETTKPHEAAKPLEYAKAHEVSKIHEPGASTSRNINIEVAKTQAEVNSTTHQTKSQEQLNHPHREKSQERSSEEGVSYTSVTKGQHLSLPEPSKPEEKIIKRHRVSRWQDDNDIPKVIEPITYKKQSRNKSRARKESKKEGNDSLHKIRSRQKFKEKKSKAPTALDKILSRESGMSRDSIMSRMIDIDLEIHKLMSEKMTLYQLLENESLLLDDNRANTNDNSEPRTKRRKEVNTEKSTPQRLSSHNRLGLEKVHHPTQQSTYAVRNKAFLLDDSQTDEDSLRKDTSVHVFDSSYEKRDRHTTTLISEAKEGSSVDHVNTETDRTSFPQENNKGKKRFRSEKLDTEKAHNKNSSSEESANALKNYKKIISRPDRKTDNNTATAREVSVESKSSTSSKDKDDSTKVKENMLENKHVTRITEDSLQHSVGGDEEKSSENVAMGSDAKSVERISIYSDDSTRESSLAPESSEPKRYATGLALLVETFRREKAISRKLKAAAKKQKHEEQEALLENVNNLTADEEEIPLKVLYKMKLRQKQNLLEGIGVKSKLEKSPSKSEESSDIIWKHAMAVINAVAENRTESLTVGTEQQPELPNLGQLVELSTTEPALPETEITVKPSDIGEPVETMASILQSVSEPVVSDEVPSESVTPKAAELPALSESGHDELRHPEDTQALTENTAKDLISKNFVEENSDIRSDTLDKNVLKELSSQVAINDKTDSLQKDHDKERNNERERLSSAEDTQVIHEISETAVTEEEDEDSSSVLNKMSKDDIECRETLLIESEDNSINQSLTNNLNDTVIDAELKSETIDSNVLDVPKGKVIFCPEKDTSTTVNEVELAIKTKEVSNTPSNTSSELESVKEIEEAVTETMDDLLNSFTKFICMEAISDVSEDCSKKKQEESPVEEIEIKSQTEELDTSSSEDLLGFPASNQTSLTEIEKIVQPSTSTSEDNKPAGNKRNRGRSKKRPSTNSSLSGTISPVPSTSTSCEKLTKAVPSRGKRKSINLETKVEAKRRRTRWSSRSSVEVPGVPKEAESLETAVDGELPSSKVISVEESKKRKSVVNQVQLKNCKVRLIDCEYTYLRSGCDLRGLQQYGISKINAYGRTISVSREPSPRIEENERSASVISVQEVVTHGDDAVHVESDKEKDSSSFCSWDQNIQEISESIDASQDSMSQNEIIDSKDIDNYETIENRGDTPDIEHVYLSHLDPTVLRQDETSSPRPVIDINEDESAANTSSQSDIEILVATKGSRSVNLVEDIEGENAETTVVLEEEKSPRTEYTVHKGPVLDIKVYGDSFMAASEDGKIYRYSQVSNGILNIYRGHKSAVTCLSIPKIKFCRINKQWLFSGSLDGTLRCYEIDSGQQVREPVDVGSPIQCMDHAWGVIYLGTKSGHVSRFHIKSGVMKGDNIQFSEVSVLALKATSEGPRRVLIVASRNQPITIRDAQNGLFLRTVSGHKNHTVYSLMMDHHMVYCGTSGTLIPVFDFITAKQVAQYNAGVGIVCMRLYKKLLFAGCYDGNIYVFNTKDRKLVCSIPGPGNMLLSMEVVDNKIIAGSKDRGLHIWLMPKTVRALINSRTRNTRMKEI